LKLIENIYYLVVDIPENTVYTYCINNKIVERRDDNMRHKGQIHNQLRLNAKIKETYGDKYSDWADYALSLQSQGYTYHQIADEFNKLGVSIRYSTVGNWLRNIEPNAA
jgi:hypothetical protein